MASEKKPFAETVAEKLIEQLKQGTAPWQKPWSPGPAGSGMPMNPTTGNRYKGINAIHLMTQGRSDSRWMTYKQASAIGAQVKKGEKSTAIQIWHFDKTISKTDANGKPVLDGEGKAVKVRVQLERPFLTMAAVFNAEQIDGLPVQIAKEQTWNSVERAEALLKASKARIQHVPGDRAFYRLSTDEITLPDKGQFESADRYYATGLHELGHWTGHPSRLNRDLSNPFGSEGYAKEELRAEIFSMILGDEIGIGHDPEQHVSYVASWIKVLQADPLEVFRAASDAEKIMTYVFSLEQKLEQQESVQATVSEDQHQETVSHLEEEDQNSIAGYSGLASWMNLERTAQEHGLKAFMSWTDEGESEPDIRIHYRDDQDLLIPIHTDLHSGDGKAVTHLNGSRLPGTGYTSDHAWQSDALSSAVATMLSRGREQEASMGQKLPNEETSKLQRTAELWVLKHLTGDMAVAIDRMNERQLIVVMDVLESMLPLGNQTPFWQRHEVAAEVMYNDPDTMDSSIIATLGMAQDRLDTLRTEQQSSPLELAASNASENIVAPATDDSVAQNELASDAERDRIVARALTEFRALQRKPGNESSAAEFMASVLQPALESAFETEVQLPDDWTGNTWVRGCVETEEGIEQVNASEEAEFFGIYAEDGDGLHPWAADCDSEEQANDLASRLHAIYAMSQTESPELPDVFDDPDLQARIAEIEMQESIPRDLASSVDESPVKLANLAKERTWLAIPFEEKEEAKALAGNLSTGKSALGFDKETKCWFAHPGADLDKLQRWIPDSTQPRQTDSKDPREEFAEAMEEAGLSLDSSEKGNHPIMDGERHRVKLVGAKGNKQDGMYVLHGVKPGEKGIPAGYIANNRTGVSFNWKAKGYSLSEADKANLHASAAATVAKAKAEREVKQHIAEKAIDQLLKISGPAPADHTYLIGKEARAGDLRVVPADASGLPSDSLVMIGRTAKESKALREAHPDNLVFTAGDLLLTAQDIDGNVKAVQSIRTNGTKMFARDTVKQEHFHVVGGDGMEALANAPVIVIGEGYATADTLSECLGHATVSAFDSGNLPAVAKVLRSVFPDKPIIIAGDNDLHQELTDDRNPGRTKAQDAAKAVDGKAIFPVFAPGEQAYPESLGPVDREKVKRGTLPPEQQEAINQMKKFTDFNDLATRSVLGREGLERQVKAEVDLIMQKHTQQQTPKFAQVLVPEQTQRRVKTAAHGR